MRRHGLFDALEERLALPKNWRARICDGRLRLQANALDVQEIQEIAGAPEVTSLHVSRSPLVPYAARVLAEAPHLKRLALRECNLTNAAATELALSASIEFLDLGSNQIESLGARALALNPIFRFLSVADNPLKNAGVAAFAETTRIPCLNLSWTGFGNNGAARFISNASVQSIVLQSSLLGASGRLALAEWSRRRTEAGMPVRITGVDLRSEQSRADQSFIGRLAKKHGWPDMPGGERGRI